MTVRKSEIPLNLEWLMLHTSYSGLSGLWPLVGQFCQVQKCKIFIFNCNLCENRLKVSGLSGRVRSTEDIDSM